MNYTIADYDKCLSKLKTIFSVQKDVISIMQFGNISAPGCSDIDLIFVIKEDKKTFEHIINCFETQFTVDEKYLIYQHQPYFVSDTIAPKINFIRPCSNIRHVYGNRYDVQEDFDVYHKMYLLVELLTNYYPTYLTSFSDTRLNLQIINAFHFVLDIYRDLECNFGLSDSLYAKVGSILKENSAIRRTKGFDSLRAKRFVKVAQKQLLDIVFFIFEQLDHGLQRCMKNGGPLLDHITYKGKIFSKKTRKMYLLKVFGRTFNLMHYPLSFYYLFGASSCLINDLQKSIEKRNQVLELYRCFCSKYTSGNVFYLPWWIRWDKSSHSVIKRFMLDVLGVL
jgi:hypothetical protein